MFLFRCKGICAVALSGVILVSATGCSAGPSAPGQPGPRVPVSTTIETPAVVTASPPSAVAAATQASLIGGSGGVQVGSRSVVSGGTEPKQLFIPGASEPQLISCADEVREGEKRLNGERITVQLTDESSWATVVGCPVEVAGTGLSAATNVARILLFDDGGARVQSFDAALPADYLDNVLLVGEKVILAVSGAQAMSLLAFSGASGEAVWQREFQKPEDGWRGVMDPASGFVNADGELVVSDSVSVMGLDPTTGATIWVTPAPEAGVGGSPTFSTDTHVLLSSGILMRQSDGAVVRSDLRTAAVDQLTNTAALTAGFNASFEIIDLDTEQTLFALSEEEVRTIDGVYVLGGFDGVFYVWTGASGLETIVARTGEPTADSPTQAANVRFRNVPIESNDRFVILGATNTSGDVFPTTVVSFSPQNPPAIQDLPNLVPE